MSKKKSIVSVKVIKRDINRALKKFKRGVIESGHLMELRERKYYIKPKTVRRKAKQQAIREQGKLTILEKIENGDPKASLLLRKKKRKKSNKPQNKNKSTQK